MDINELYKDYLPDTDVFTEEDEKMARLKNIIFSKLDEIDRRIILFYASEGTMRKTAEKLNVSTSTAYIRIKDIQKKIKEYYGNEHYS